MVISIGSRAGIAAALAELLGRPVVFAEDCVGEAADAAIGRARASDGALVLLGVNLLTFFLFFTVFLINF